MSAVDERVKTAVFLWPEQALFVGPRSATQWHAHHACEVSVALDDRLDLSVDPGVDLRGVPGAVVGAAVRHRLTIHGPRVAVLYVDPMSPAGAAIARHVGTPGAQAVPTAVVHEHGAALGELANRPCLASAAALCDAILDATAGPRPARPRMDPRIAGVVARIDGAPEARWSAAALAAGCGLSSSRFIHLFREQVGLPLRRYLLWVRMRCALTHAFGGTTLTEAAHAGGFADGAHFTRTCRKIFGLAPSAFTPIDAFVVAAAQPPPQLAAV